MKKISIVSASLIAVTTLIFTCLSIGYFHWNRYTAAYFTGEILAHITLPAVIAWLLWRFIFKRKPFSGLLSFACLYFITMLPTNIQRAKELDKSAAAIRELNILFQSSDQGVDQGVEQEVEQEAEILCLRNKSYSENDYSDWTPVLDYMRKEKIFTHDTTKEWQKAREQANIDAMLTFETLCDRQKLLESRKALETLYSKLIAIQRKSVNYYSNLFLVLKNYPFKKKITMEPRLKKCEQHADSYVTFCWDYYDNQLNLLFVLDDLCLFLLSLGGNYRHTDDAMEFTNDIEVAKYRSFFRHIDRLAEQETEIFANFNRKAIIELS